MHSSKSTNNVGSRHTSRVCVCVCVGVCVCVVGVSSGYVDDCLLKYSTQQQFQYFLPQLFSWSQ